MSYTEPIKDKNKLKELASHYFKKGQVRNHALIVAGVHTALRISDLLSLKWEDVLDEKTGRLYSHITVIEKKTRKVRHIAINAEVKRALERLYRMRRGAYIFANNRKDASPISRVQAWRIITAAVNAVGISGHISCHSLRKTFGYFAWKAGVLPLLLMDIFNHSSFEVTKRYLGISQDDRDEVYLGMKLF